MATRRWTWAYEFVILVLLPFILITNKLHATRVLLVGLLAVLSTLKMFGSNTFLCAPAIPCKLKSELFTVDSDVDHGTRSTIRPFYGRVQVLPLSVLGQLGGSDSCYGCR